MLSSLDFLRILCFKVLNPESKPAEPDGVVDVFERGNEWGKEHQVFEFFCCLKLFSAVTFAS